METRLMYTMCPHCIVFLFAVRRFLWLRKNYPIKKLTQRFIKMFVINSHPGTPNWNTGKRTEPRVYYTFLSNTLSPFTYDACMHGLPSLDVSLSVCEGHIFI
eukprot:TRINITY_DN1804_c0_g1_i1.p1 TRINITY_DN1804_c0_g1~~TRINITY_DN1804_c0_g1_i1.p1  ORF type:complete len:102 (-),score=3.01 TRINITY_DN1804_c0_g1_i1:328-633(-)